MIKHSEKLSPNEAIEGLKVIASSSRNGKDFLFKSASLVQEQAEKLVKIEKAWRNGSGEDVDIALQESFETNQWDG